LAWAYYGHSLSAELKAPPAQPNQQEGQSQADLERDWLGRARLRRLYFYVLAFLGLLAAFVGMQIICTDLLGLALGGVTLGIITLRNQLAAAIAAALMGLPLWILTWRSMAKEAARPGEMGDEARRSLVRKSYLYLILFSSVLGAMFSVGALIYQILRILLGQQVTILFLASMQSSITLLLFSAVLVYHWLILRGDGKQAEQ
jgi:hypothetical protein